MFFPDATRGEVRSVSLKDVSATETKGILVNTYHIKRLMGEEQVKKSQGIKKLIGWSGPMISDSGGFQIMSMVKRSGGTVEDAGVTFEMEGTKHHMSPEDSVRFQLLMRTDLCVVLDDFTPPDATHEEAEETVKRTTEWAKRCKDEFDRICNHTGNREDRNNTGNREGYPYLVGVVQGGEYEDLRLRSIKELVEIGFDGYGYGGFPMKNGKFDEKMVKFVADNLPRDTLLYGLGIGKPDDIVKSYRAGWQVFDCVLPTRDARHGRLYVYTAEKMEEIDLNAPKFYEYYNPRHANHLEEAGPVSGACDCELCTTLTRAEFAGMWRERDKRVLRLATIHNLRFYQILMEKLKNVVK